MRIGVVRTGAIRIGSLSRFTPHFVVVMLLLNCMSGCRSFRSAEMANAGMARELTLHGLTALHRGKTEQAESLLQQAAQTAPEDARIRQHLAQAMMERGQMDQAELELKNAIGLCNGDPSMHVDLGKLYLVKGQPKLAMVQADKALEHNGQMAEAWLLKGDCQRLLSDEKSALECYHMASNCDTACSSSQTQLAIAEVHSQVGDHVKALTALDLYRRHYAPDQLPLKASLLEGKTLISLRQYPLAIEKLLLAANRPQAGPEIWMELSRAQQLNGDLSNARLTALSAIQKFPTSESLRLWSENLAQARSAEPPTSVSR